MNPLRFRKMMVGVLTAGVAVGGASVGALTWRICQAVRKQCAIAQAAFPHAGDDVAALRDMMNSGSHALRDRNLAVWTLGRLSDPRALPDLQRACTGDPCDHNKQLCQYELRKAIERCGRIPKSSRNITH